MRALAGAAADGEEVRREQRPTETPTSPAASQLTNCARLAGKKLQAVAEPAAADVGSLSRLLCRNRVLEVST